MEPGAYVTGYGARSLYRYLAGYVLPVMFVVAGIRSGPDAWWAVVIGGLIAAGLTAAIVIRLRRLLRREIKLVIDSRGVWLGADSEQRPAVQEPWDAIDAVVYFDSWLHSQNADRRVPHLGVVRNRKIVTFRNVEDWKIDRRRAAAAVARFGRGVPFRSAPIQPDVPGPYYSGIALPDDWFGARP